MHASNRSFDKRLLATVMLFVWLFVVGANLANACLVEGMSTQTVPHERHDRSPMSAMFGMSEASQGHGPIAPVHGGDEHAPTHLVHCQAAQAIAHVPTPWKSPANAIERDAMPAATAHGSMPMVQTGHPGFVWRGADPAVPAVPLFIRFRRLRP